MKRLLFTLILVTINLSLAQPVTLEDMRLDLAVVKNNLEQLRSDVNTLKGIQSQLIDIKTQLALNERTLNELVATNAKNNERVWTNFVGPFISGLIAAVIAWFVARMRYKPEIES